MQLTKPMNNRTHTDTTALQAFVDSLSLDNSPVGMMNALEMLADDHSHLWPRFDDLHQGRLVRAARKYMNSLATVEVCQAIKDTIEKAVDDPSGIDYPSLCPSSDRKHIILGHQTAGMRCEWDGFIPWANGVDGKVTISISRPQGIVLQAIITYSKTIKIAIDVDEAIQLRPDHVDYLIDCLDAFLGRDYARDCANRAHYDVTGVWGDESFVYQSCSAFVWQALHAVGIQVALVSHIPHFCGRDESTVVAPEGFVEWLALDHMPSLEEAKNQAKPDIEQALAVYNAAKAPVNGVHPYLGDYWRFGDEFRASTKRALMAALFLPRAAQRERTTESWKQLEAIVDFVYHGLSVPFFDEMAEFDYHFSQLHAAFLRYRAYWRMVAGIK